MENDVWIIEKFSTDDNDILTYQDIKIYLIAKQQKNLAKIF